MCKAPSGSDILELAIYYHPLLQPSDLEKAALLSSNPS